MCKLLSPLETCWQYRSVRMLILVLRCQVAFKNTQTGIHYVTDRIPLSALLLENGNMEPLGFPPAWQALPPSNEVAAPISGACQLPCLCFSTQNEDRGGIRGHAASTPCLPWQALSLSTCLNDTAAGPAAPASSAFPVNAKLEHTHSVAPCWRRQHPWRRGGRT